MEILNFWELLLLEAGLAGLFVSFVLSRLQQVLHPGKPTGLNPHSSTSEKPRDTSGLPPTRSIKKRLQQTCKRCVVFFGTQTGTAEKLALALSKELSARFNFSTMVADLDDFDYSDLTSMEPGQLVIFTLATYGEGEPTDNAIGFDGFLRSQMTQARDAALKSMSSLQYAVFGLGSSSYQFFNGMITQVDESLQICGATRIGSIGLGDDGKGTLESDFIEWKEATLAKVAQYFNLNEVDYMFKPSFVIQELPHEDGSNVFLGEPNKGHLLNKIRGPFTVRNPYPAKIVEARELFTSTNQNCLHLEFDISATTMVYETGDHLAIWPVNSNLEVERFLKILGLFKNRRRVIDIKPNDPTVRVPILSKTTYEAAARYYLDICGPVSLQTLATLAALTSGIAQTGLQELTRNAAVFQRNITDKQLNISQALKAIAPSGSWSAVPFSFFLESIARLQPRYYSISSSSLVSRKRISVTAVVDSVIIPDSRVPFKGVSTNYLLALKHQALVAVSTDGCPPVPETHDVHGPRDIYKEPTALICVRPSKFRLPRNLTTPVIMIGPGTGVAPFRGFVHERALQARAGREVGRTILFYGCRRSDEDFLYRDEWQAYALSFAKDTFSVHAAFSREDPNKKVYVQDLVWSHGDELKRLVLTENAHVYICGDASRMSKDVFRTFGEIINGCVEESGESYLKSMKASGRWCEDVW